MKAVFVSRHAISKDVFAGRHLLVSGRPEQIAERADRDGWKPWAGEPVDPFPMDLEAEERELAESARMYTLPPMPPVTRPEMRELFNCDDDSLNIAMSRFGCPRAQLVHTYGDDLLNPTGHSETWDRRAVMQWLEDARRVLGPIVNVNTSKVRARGLRTLVGG